MSLFQKTTRRPLVIASSGGGGLLMAADSIIKYYKEENPDSEFEQYTARLYKEESNDFIALILRIGLWFLSLPFLGNFFRRLNDYFELYNLPQKDAFDEGIRTLNNGRIDADGNGKKYEFIDMLLDVYPSGYEICSIFNTLQLNDNIKDMEKTIRQQSFADWYNYYPVKRYILNLLIKSQKNVKPYTEIICTQPMSLDAITDAIIEYNKKIVDAKNAEWDNIQNNISYYQEKISILQKEIQSPDTWQFVKWFKKLSLFFYQKLLQDQKDRSKTHGGKELEQVHLKLYMPDLATTGSCHYFEPLNKFTPEQRGLVELYAVAPLENSLSKFEHHEGFKKIVCLDKENNTMLRKAFKKTEELKKYLDTSVEHIFHVKGEPKEFSIEPKAKVAAIMLGSLAGNGTVKYIRPLLDAKYQQIIIFRGTNKDIDAYINENFSDEERQKIICLDKQDDDQIAPIMARSNCVVTRCGGLSIAEHMAIPMLPDKRFLIHHSDATNITDDNLRIGLPWEEGNADCLIKYVEKNRGNTYAVATKTFPNPERIAQDLQALKEEQEKIIVDRNIMNLASRSKNSQYVDESYYDGIMFVREHHNKSMSQSLVTPKKHVLPSRVNPVNDVGFSRSL